MESTPSDETAAWCALLRAPGVGCQTLNPLLAAGQSACDLLARPPAGVPPALRDYLRAPDWQRAEQDMRWLEQPRCHLLRISDPAYPRRLLELPNPPSALFLHGDPRGSLLDLFLSRSLTYQLKIAFCFGDAGDRRQRFGAGCLELVLGDG